MSRKIGPSNPYPKFSEVLIKYLKRKKLRKHGHYAYLAALLNMERQTVHKWVEYDCRPGSPETVIRIAGLLELNSLECKSLLEAAEYPTSLKDYKVIFEKKIKQETEQALKSIEAEQALNFIKQWLNASVDTSSIDTSHTTHDTQLLIASLEPAIKQIFKQLLQEDKVQKAKVKSEEVSLPHSQALSLDGLELQDNQSLDKRSRVSSELTVLLDQRAMLDYIREGIETDVKASVEGWRDYDRAHVDLYRREWEKVISRGEYYIRSLTASPYLVAHWLDISAIAELHCGRIHKATHLMEHPIIRSFMQSNKQSYLRASILLHQGDIFREKGIWGEANKKYDEACNVLDNIDDRKMQVRARRKLASIKLYRGELAGIQRQLDDCLARFLRFDDNYEKARTHQNLGWVYEMKGDWKMSRIHRLNALALAMNHKIDGQYTDNYLIAMSRTHLGSDYRQSGEYEEAETQLVEALKLANIIKAERYEGYAYLELTHIFRLKGIQGLGTKQAADNVTAEVLGYFAKAEEYSQRACDIYPLHYPYYHALALIGRGKLFLDASAYIEGSSPEQNLVIAEELLGKAMKTFRDLECYYYEAMARVYLCELYLKKNNAYPAYSAKNSMLSEEIQKIEALHQEHSYPRWIAHAWMIQAIQIAGEQPIQIREAVEFCAKSLCQASRFNNFVWNQTVSEFERVVKLVMQQETLPLEEVDFLKEDGNVSLLSGREFGQQFCRKVAESLQTDLLSNSIGTMEQVTSFVDKIEERWRYI